MPEAIEEGGPAEPTPREPLLTQAPELPEAVLGPILAVPLLFMIMLIAVGALVPDDHREVGYAVGGIAMTALALTVVGITVARRQKRREALVQSFTQGTARVLSVRETGVRIQRRPQVEVKLEVELPGEAPYTAVHFATGSRKASMVEGQELSVACDPEDHRNMFVDWGPFAG